jgi:hypothetical protein
VPSEGAVNFGSRWVGWGAGLDGARHVNVDLKVYIWTRVRLV